MNHDGELLVKDECALLLVDLQKVLIDACAGRELVAQNGTALMDFCLLLGIPVFLTVQNSPKLGEVLPELVARMPEPAPYNKLEFSCFENEAISRALLNCGRRSLLLAGIETHVCVLQTAIDALRLGFRVDVAADATGSRSPKNHELGLQRMRRAGVVVSSVEMIAYELLKSAGTEPFRQALPLLKALPQSA